jgi:hypothetical protein
MREGKRRRDSERMARSRGRRIGGGTVEYIRSNLIGFVALFVALGGSAYATHSHRMGTQDLKNRSVAESKVANKAVSPRTIREHAVKAPKIATEAIRPRHIIDGAVTGDKLAPGVAVSGPQGPPGPQGAPGPQGSPGAQGASGATNVRSRIASDTAPAEGATKTVRSNCNPGEVATGGGSGSQIQQNMNVTRSTPVPVGGGVIPTGWEVTYHNAGTSGAGVVFAYVICASP